jgi:hypothetical protein
MIIELAAKCKPPAIKIRLRSLSLDGRRANPQDDPVQAGYLGRVDRVELAAAQLVCERDRRPASEGALAHPVICFGLIGCWKAS